MTFKGILLAGAALCCLSVVPALASSAPHVHVLALHPAAVVKSQMHNSRATAVTYTFSVSTTVSTKAAYNKTTPLGATYYTWLDNSTICDEPKKETITLSTAKTLYATLGTGTETYVESGCSKPTIFYGDTYDLTTKKAKNKTDSFVSTLKAKFKNANGKMNGTLNLDVSVAITK